MLRIRTPETTPNLEGGIFFLWQMLSVEILAKSDLAFEIV
jgi:hypothetical protein